MGMSIDEAIRRISHHNYIHQRREPRAIYITEAFKIATSTMRKYQKIEQIVNAWDDDENAMILAHKIKEVLENGSNNQYSGVKDNGSYTVPPSESQFYFDMGSQ